MAGQVKISLHSSGYRQHGYTAPVRDLLPPGGERGALDRWEQPGGAPGILEPAYSIYFPGSELLPQDQELPKSTVLISMQDEKNEITVGVFFVEPPLPPVEDGPGPLHHLGRLNLGHGGSVDLLWVELGVVRERIEEAQQLLYTPARSREMPVALSREWDYAYAFGIHPADGSSRAGKRWALELAVDLGGLGVEGPSS